MAEWLEIVDGKLKHHIQMDVCGDEFIHIVAQGELHYGEWLMMEEENLGMTWKKAIAERGSEEKMKEFVEYYNNLKGERK